jgi:hypothetical protein
MTHPLLDDLEQARVTYQAKWDADGYNASRNARNAFEEAQRRAKDAGGHFFDWMRVPGGSLQDVGILDGEIYNPRQYPVEQVTAALTDKLVERAHQEELAKPDEAVAAAFVQATTAKAISWRLGDIVVRRDGSIIIKGGPDRPTEQVRAEAIAQLARAGAAAKARRSHSARKGGVTALRRQLRDINLLVSSYLETGRWTAAHQCRCCHKQLTDATSIDRGIGPECYARILAVVEAARLRGGPVDTWSIVIDEVVSELPQRIGGRCSVCGNHAAWGVKLSGRKFCKDCDTRIHLETARRLRLRGEESESAEFEAWVATERLVGDDPELRRALEAERDADAACEAAERLYGASLRAAVDKDEREKISEAYWQARRAQCDAWAAAKNVEKAARERVRTQQEVAA